tara:strand:- start:28367 stop:28906 length:540 start_codon:yes stop_codon:yes gene_type:complete
MIKYLADNNTTWFSIAMNITKNKQDAEDLVQDMYLKVHDLKLSTEDKERRSNPSFISVVLWNMFKEKVRSNKNTKNLVISIDEYDNKVIVNQVSMSSGKEFEVDDKQLSTLSKANQLSVEEKTLISLNYDYSIRQLAEIKETNYGTVNRSLEKIRRKVLQDDYSTSYKNKRLKYRKNVK